MGNAVKELSQATLKFRSTVAAALRDFSRADVVDGAAYAARVLGLFGVLVLATAAVGTLPVCLLGRAAVADLVGHIEGLRPSAHEGALAARASTRARMLRAEPHGREYYGRRPLTATADSPQNLREISGGRTVSLNQWIRGAC